MGRGGLGRGEGVCVKWGLEGGVRGKWGVEGGCEGGWEKFVGGG
jgi:hypothetical protein